MTRSAFLGMLVLLPVGACRVETIDEVSCPNAGTSLTYENFGERFLAMWCMSCHSGASDHSSHVFETVEEVRAQRDRIFANAAGTNRAMPPGPDGPSDADRQKLAEWLACGAP